MSFGTISIEAVLLLLHGVYCGPTTPNIYTTLKQCPNEKGIFTKDDFCSLSKGGVLLKRNECILPKTDVTLVKQLKLDVLDCSRDTKTTTYKKCTPSDMKHKNENLCVDEHTVYGVDSEGTISCKVEPPRVALGHDHLAECDSFREALMSHKCALEWKEVFRLGAIKPDLMFCTMLDDEDEIEVTQDGESCLVPKESVPASVLKHCSNDKRYPDEDDINFAMNCSPFWYSNRRHLGPDVHVCTFRVKQHLHYFIWDRAKSFICRILPIHYLKDGMDNKHVQIKVISCPPEAFKTILLLDFDPPELKECAFSTYHSYHMAKRKPNRIVCRVKIGYLMYNFLSGKICKIPKEYWPKRPQDFQRNFKPCEADILMKADLRITEQLSPELQGKRKATADVEITVFAPKKSKPDDMERTVPALVEQWVSDIYTDPFLVEDIVLTVRSKGTAVRKNRQAPNQSSVQTKVEIQTQFTVVVLSQNVEGTDFPADLARALKKNVHKFDETGTYTVDPRSITVKEVSAGRSKTRSREESKGHWNVLVGSAIILTLLLLILVSSCFIKHSRKSGNIMATRRNLQITTLF